MSLDDPSESLVTVVETLDVETDELHDILSDRRRRYTLARLHESVEPMHLGDLAAEIGEWERENDAVADPGDAEAIHRALYHVHVAKMAHLRLVDYDGVCDKVSLADSGHRLAAHLAPASDV